MSKTTTRILTAVFMTAVCMSPTRGWTGVPAALPLVLSAATLGDDGRATIVKADALLKEARQAMSEGNCEIADSKIARAEALQPKYPLFHVGDNPKKVRSDLDKLLVQKAGGKNPASRGPAADAVAGKGSNAAKADPFLVHQAAGSSDPKSPNAGAFVATPAATPQSPGPAGRTNISSSAASPLPQGPQVADLPRMTPSARSNARPADTAISAAFPGLPPDRLNTPAKPSNLLAEPEGPKPWAINTRGGALAGASDTAVLPAAAPTAGQFEQKADRAAIGAGNATSANQNPARAPSDGMIIEARRALAQGDVRRAQSTIDQAKGLGVNYAPMDDSPAKVEALIQKAVKVQATPATAAEGSRRLRAELWMEQSEGLLRWRQYDDASRLAVEAQRLGITYGPFESKPDQLIARIAEGRRASGAPEAAPARQFETNPTPTPTPISFTPTVDGMSTHNKSRVLELSGQARAAMAKGDWAMAEQIAHQAELLCPDSAFAPGEDRPSLVLLDIQRAKQGQSSVVQTGGAWPSDTRRYPATNALYNPAADNTRNIPASSNTAELAQPMMGGPVQPLSAAPTIEARLSSGPSAIPSPDNGTGEGLRWYRAGVDAAARYKSDEARESFRRAYAFQAELDPASRQQLCDHLRALGEPVEALAAADNTNGSNNAPMSPPARALFPAAPATPTSANFAPTPGLALLSPGVPAPEVTPPQPLAPIDSAPITPPAPLSGRNENAQALARQLTVEVTRQQSIARDMKERQPKEALATLERTRDSVAKASGLDAPARDQLVRRLDASIKEMQGYIAAHGSQIDLEESNKRIEQEVDNSRKQKVQVEEKLAYLVNDFNKAVEEQRWLDAQVLAKRTTELDPENPVVTQLIVMAKMASRMAQNQSISDAKEDGFWRTMEEVDSSSIPFSGEYSMPNAKKWETLTQSKYRRQRDEQQRRSPKEMEIEQRLITPVSVKFNKRPLSEVIETLGKYGQIPTFLDPQGLQAEGVLSDTPVTIDLNQDISLKSALRLILEPLRLTYIIKDEVLKITSQEAQRGEVYKKVYNVGDLVIPIPNFAPTGREGINGAFREAYSRMGWGGAPGGSFGTAAPLTVASADQDNGGGFTPSRSVLAQMQTRGLPINSPGQEAHTQSLPFGPGGLKGGTQADFDSLIDLIKSTVAASSWDDTGGLGTIQSFEGNLSLVVSQTQEVHEQIADLLQQLRRLQDLQVTIEVRFITLQDDFFERIGVDFDFNIASNAAGLPAPNPAGPPPSFGGISPSRTVGLDNSGNVTPLRDIQFRQGGFSSALPPFGGFDPQTAATFGFAVLSDIQAFFVIQAAQGDERTNILQAPKVTLFNGQRATVSDTTQRPFVISVIPVVGDFAAAQQPVIVVLSEGTSLTVQAVVSNDRRFVRLTVVPFFSQIGNVDTFTFTGSSSSTKKSSESKQGDDNTSSSNEDDSASTATTVQLPQFSFVTVTTTVNVPDGGTVLLGGIKRLSEGRTERGVPILSKMPYINRLFRNIGIGRQTTSLMMMVTPRIIIQEEEEENLIGPQAQ